MPGQIIVQTSIDDITMAKVTDVLEKKGLSVSDALGITLRKIAHEEDFEIPHIPNAETRHALEKSMSDEGIFTANSSEELFEHLDACVEYDR